MLSVYLLSGRQTLTATLYRFPVAVIASLLFTLLALNKSLVIPHKDIYLYTLCCVVFTSIALCLGQRQPNFRWLSNVVALVSSPLIFWQYKDANIYSFESVAFLVGLFLSITVAPYISSNRDDAFVWGYNKSFWQRVGLTIVASAILMVGASLIIFTLKTLFGIQFKETLFFDIGIVIIGAFAPIFAMAGIPTSFAEPQASFPKGIKTVINYIAVPLLLIYAAILYGYILKITLAASLPRGSVAYLVSIFGLASTVVYLVAFPLWRESSGLMSWFGRHFFKCMLPPLVLLALALKTRIQEYGVTESRYLLGVTFIWLTISTLVIILKARHKVQVILTTLPVLLLAGAIGPWSMKNVSGYTQVHRLKVLLEKNEILEEGKIKAAGKQLDQATLFNICSIVDYLINIKKTQGLLQWFNKDESVDANKILAKMGLNYVPQYKRRTVLRGRELRDYEFYTEGGRKQYEPVKVSGYDFWLNFEAHKAFSNRQNKNIALKNNGRTLNLHLSLNDTNTVLTIVNDNNNKVLTFDLTKIVQKSMLENKSSDNKLIKDFIFTQANAELEVTLMLDKLSGYFIGDKLKLENFEAILLFKMIEKN